MIPERFREYAARHDMLPEGCRVLCACSGGADSTALLHLLCATPGLTVAAAHFNHGLRGEAADRDEQFVRALCERLGVELFCGRGDVAGYAAAQHLGVEEAARALRYAFLEQTADAQGFDRIATAHHAEDNAETVLLNLTRGAGLRGLCGIPPVRGRIVRPLLFAARGEILEYLAENGLDYVTDATNDADGCARNRIRHRVLPLLTEENPAAVAHIGAASELLRRDEAYLSDLAEEFIEESCAGGAVPVPGFLALPESVGTRVLRILLGQVSRRHTEALYALCRSEEAHAALDLPGRRVVKDRGRLLTQEAPVQPLARREVPFGETALPELGLRIIRRLADPGEEIHNSFNTFFFQCGSIRDIVFVASRAPGDAVRLQGRGCTKTLKKLFAEARLPLAQRERTPVFYDAQGVIAVYGFGVAERCAVSPGEAAECIELREIQET